MRRAIDVLIYVLHPQRELDAAVILCALLKRDYGLSAVVASYLYDDYEIMAKFSPKVVAIPFLYGPEKGFSRTRKYFPSARIVNLAWEQLYSPVSASGKHVQGGYAHSEMIFLAWGEEYRQFLMADGVNPDNIRIVGCPACGLLQPPYADKFACRSSLAAKHGLDPEARWLFLPENWRAAYMTPSEYAVYDKGGAVGRGLAFHEWSKKSMEACCRWLQQAPGRTEIIFRPRPFVDRDEFQAFVQPWLGGAKQVHIISEGTVKEWVLASDAVMSGLSSTLLEAASAQKPTYVLAPVTVPQEFGTEWLSLGRQITTLEQFNEQLCLSPRLERDTRLETWVSENLMVTQDPLASMAQALADCVHQQKVGRPGRQSELPLWLSARTKCARDGMKRAVRGQKKKRSRNDEFTQEEVELLTLEWTKVLG